MNFECTPIGVVHSCFKDKFGVPRQPGLVKGARGEVELFPPYDRAEAFTGLEVFSNIWLTFVFHHCLDQQARLSVRPPRLGGNKKMGVFATRATHRPNPIGMSVVTLDSIVKEQGKVRLCVSGLDLVDGTPILDIKPYLPYADGINNAKGGFAQSSPESAMQVVFSSQAESECAQFEQRWPELRSLLLSVLSLDPRPAYRSGQAGDKLYALRVYDLDVQWRALDASTIEVVRLVELAG